LRDFFTKYHKDYFNAYGRSDRARLVKEAKKLAAVLFEKLYELAQNRDSDSFSGFFKTLDNRKSNLELYDLQKLKAKGEEWKSYLRVYGIKYRGRIIVTGGAIKLTKEMRNRPHTRDELKKLELVKMFLGENNPELNPGYLDIE